MEDTPPTARDRLVDAALVVGAALIGANGVLAPAGGGDAVPWPALDLVVVLAGSAALWWRRRFPVALAVALVVLTAAVDTVTAAAAVALFTVAVHRPFRTAAALFVAGMAAAGVHHLLLPDDTYPLPMVAGWLAALYVAAVAWGLAARSRRELIDSLRDRARAAEVEAGLRAERVQHEARETLAREMHDALGHRLSLLSVHAGALAYHRGASPEEMGRAAEVVRENAHRALQDLREVIGVLRAPVGELPLPGAADVGELVEETRRAGTAVALSDGPGVTTGGHPVPETAGRTLYRFVQEGLTNARKHAPGAPVAVRVAGGPGQDLVTEIENRAVPPAPTPPAGSGEGLRGLAERAALVGGRVEYGPTASGGWRVSMRLPWPR